MEIGKKLRQLRVKNGLTLEELASRTELTKGFLSQLENDLTSPSIATLVDIVEALGLDLSAFFKTEKAEQIVFKNDDYFIDEQDEFTIHWIVPNAQKNEMEPIMLEINPGGSSNIIEPHEGEEFGYVLQGKVVLYYGDEKNVISKGQTFYINGNKTHSLVNEYQQTAKVIWVCTPPVF